MPFVAFASSAKQCFQKQEILGRSASSAVDAKFAAARATTGEDPLSKLRAIRNGLARSLKKGAQEPGRETRFNIDLIRTMIVCLETSVEPPPSLPEPFAAYVRTVVLGAKSGLGSKTLISELRAAAAHAEALYWQAGKAFRRFDSATTIAADKRTAEYLKRADRPDHRALIAALEKRVAHRTAVHRVLWPTRNPNRAAKLARATGKAR